MAMKTLVAQFWLLLVLFPYLVCQRQIVNCEACRFFPLSKYYQPGEFIYGGIFHQSPFLYKALNFRGNPSGVLSYVVLTENYQYILAFAFAVKEINENHQLLPNITVGFNIYDSHLTVRWIYHALLQFISPKNNFVPNYKCGNQGNLLAVIEQSRFTILQQIHYVLDMYKVPQLIYCYDAVNTGVTSHFSLYEMVPKGTYQYTQIRLLLQHFDWRWIGFLVADSIILEWFVQNIFPEFSRSGICIAVIESFTSLHHKTWSTDPLKSMQKVHDVVMNSNVNVMVFCGGASRMIIMRWLLKMATEIAIQKPKGKVWLLTSEVELKHISEQQQTPWPTQHLPWPTQHLHGSLSFSLPSHELQGFQQFLQIRNPSNAPGDGFLKDLWRHAFNCDFEDTLGGDENRSLCTGEEKLESLPNHILPKRVSWQGYSIYNAVYAVAHALHAMYLSTLLKRKKVASQHFQAWQLHHILKSVSFNNSMGEQIFFAQNGHRAPRFDILNWITFPNQSFCGIKVGSVDFKFPIDEALTIYEDIIVWPNWFNKTQPVSLCNAKCQLGYRKKKKEGEAFCCYDCIPCPKGWISDKPDMANCFKCPEGQYSNEYQNSCIPKIVTFLSYDEPLGISLGLCAISFSLSTALILGLFIKHRGTPFVKANNQNITFTLLISLLLCFLSGLLFIGQPQKVTCLFQQAVFAIVFTIALSSVLAKTVTVVLAFMVTQPGSKIKKWMGKKLACFIVLSCTIFQAGICLVWLVTSPPFPDTDLHSLPDAIVLYCNQSSAVMNCIVMSYMGLLTLASFILAFFARKLPNNFNEARFIAFSMLVFSSVWLTFLPMYLSKKGKYTAAVEIFSILSSGAGLLTCIFVPKCYIIIKRPELNERKHFRL